MTKFEVIFVPDKKFIHLLAERLTEFFVKHPEATLVSIDLGELRALVMYEVEDK